MKANKILSILSFALFTLILFNFETCPTGSSGGSNEIISIPNLGGNSNFIKPSWAINKAGNIQFGINSTSPLIYNRSTGLDANLQLYYYNSMYDGEHNPKVCYKIYSIASVEPDSGTFEANPPLYINGSLQSVQNILGNIKISLPAGLSTVPASITLTIDYNITDVYTKIEIPFILTNSQSQNQPVYFTSSPVIPSSSYVQIKGDNGLLSFALQIKDAAGCFSGVDDPDKKIIKIEEPTLKIVAGKNIITVRNGQNGFSCSPIGNVKIQNATLNCQIDTNSLVSAYPTIRDIVNSKTGALAYID
ncbi:MAG: hypothetical protein ACP5G1_01910, partial [Nanopusillaceae archaeon]